MKDVYAEVLWLLLWGAGTSLSLLSFPSHFLDCLFPLCKLAPFLEVASSTALVGAVEPGSSWVRLSGGREVVLAWLSSLTSAWNILGLP